MEFAPSHRDYLATPAGRAIRGEGWLAFCARLSLPGLWGFSVQGQVAGDAAAALIETIRRELDDDVPPHRSLIDARRLTGVDPRSFEAFSRYVQVHHAVLGRQVQALAIVRPPGLEGAVVAGFFQVLPPPYPVMVVDSVAAGLAALGEDEAPLAGLVALLDRLDDSDAVDVLLGRLQALCRRQPRLEIDEAAVALAVSVRTLQRRLKDAGTSFSDVVGDVRLQQALARIAGSDASLTAIAFECGYASLQHIKQTIQQTTKKSPSILQHI
jgi:AraC-like DNA-binding protein